jgi:hypothetical protein
MTMQTPQTGATRPPTAPRFPLGRLVATPGALAAFLATQTHPLRYVERHAQGDWGDCDAADWRANDRALGTGARLFSVYTLPDGTRVWIITEADRASTCVLLPEEY